MEIVLQNLTKIFPSRNKKSSEEVIAVNDFSFTIPDGKLVGRQMAPECPVSRVEQFILVSTECHGYNRVFKKSGEAGEATDKGCCAGDPVPELFDAILPDFFEVDYVRVFDAI